MDKKKMTSLIFDCCEKIINVWAKPQIDRLEMEIKMIKEEIKKVKGEKEYMNEDKIEIKLVEIIKILKLRHAEFLNNACEAIDEDYYNMRINEVLFIQGQITMAKEVMKWIKMQ